MKTIREIKEELQAPSGTETSGTVPGGYPKRRSQSGEKIRPGKRTAGERKTAD